MFNLRNVVLSGNSDDVKELLAKQTTHVDCLDKVAENSSLLMLFT